MKHKSEYAAFDEIVRKLLKVRHAEIKAKLEKEKKEGKKRNAGGGKSKATSPTGDWKHARNEVHHGPVCGN